MPVATGSERLRYANFVFDLDGTLFDSAPEILHLLAMVMRELGRPVPPMNNKMIGPLLEHIVRDLCPEASEAERARIVTTYRHRYRNSDYRETRVFSGIPALLERLHATGRSVFVATNKPADVTHRLLTIKGLLPYISGAACSDSVAGRQISKGEMLRLLMKRHGVLPEDTVMVGDSVYDMQGAREASVATMAALYGYGRREALLETAPDFVVEDVAWQHVLRWPERIPQAL